MRISRQQFISETQNPTVGRTPIALIGMAGIGKTHWSKALAHHFDYQLAEADAGIAGLLGLHAQKDSQKAVGEWLGYPWQDGFPQREQQYLAAERETLARIMYKNNCVIDTAGSAIYVPDLMADIRKRALVVYMDATGREIELLRKYRSRPRAICWNGLFIPQEGEEFVQTYSRLLPKLMETRAKLYEQFADVTIEASSLVKTAGIPTHEEVQKFVASIAGELPSL